MESYDIVPEFQYFKNFSSFAIAYQFVTIGCIFLGRHTTSVGYILALLFQVCSLYYVALVPMVILLLVRDRLVTICSPTAATIPFPVQTIVESFG